MSFSVIQCTGTGRLTYHILVLVDALLMGYRDGQDILTLSLGNVGGWSEATISVVASRIADQGKVVTIIAGNDVSPPASYLSPVLRADHKNSRAIPVLGIAHALEPVSTSFL